MNTRNREKPLVHKFPDFLRPFFWDYDFDSLSWGEDHELIVARILSSGDWNAMTWLRSHTGDHFLREWIERHEGDGLSPQKLRFWELVLGLPHHKVNTWLAAERQKIWEKRVNP
jgi:hypothetical protein